MTVFLVSPLEVFITIKSWHGNIFVLILKKKMAITGVFRLFSREFCWPSRTKGITVKRCQICRISSSLQNLGWKYFWSHFEKTRWLPQGFLWHHEKCLLYSPAASGGYFSLAFTTPHVERFSVLTF